VDGVTHGAWHFQRHYLGDLEIVSVVSGVGKVFCASATQLLIALFAPGELYMTGICGGLRDELWGGSVVVPERVCQHDVESPATPGDPFDLYQGRSTWYEPDASLLQRFREFRASTTQTHFGIVVSGDQRIRSAERRDVLRREFAAIAVDQELAAFAQVCTVNRVPFLGLKAVSDNADEQTEHQQKLHKLEACDAASNALIGFLATLNEQSH
jgi:adenosylhomocysteine nucleosidase